MKRSRLTKSSLKHEDRLQRVKSSFIKFCDFVGIDGGLPNVLKSWKRGPYLIQLEDVRNYNHINIYKGGNVVATIFADQQIGGSSFLNREISKIVEYPKKFVEYQNFIRRTDKFEPDRAIGEFEIAKVYRGRWKK